MGHRQMELLVPTETRDDIVKYTNPAVFDIIARVYVSHPDGKIDQEGAMLIIEELALYGFQII